MARVPISSKIALMRPCHPPMLRPVSGSVTSGLTTTLSPFVQFLLSIFLPMSNILPPREHTLQVYHTAITSDQRNVSDTDCHPCAGQDTSYLPLPVHSV